MTSPADPGALDAGRPATLRVPAIAASAAASGRFVLAALTAVLALSIVPGVTGLSRSKSSAGDADIRVTVDGDASAVLCAIDAAGHARCFGRDAILAGAVDAGAGPAICGMADRPLVSPCPAGRECTFPRVAASAEPLGLVLLEPRPPLFGVPRHRLIDAVVMAPDPAAAPPQLAAGVGALARCFAPHGPSGDSRDTAVSWQACESEPCRLGHSTVRVAKAAR